MSLDTHSPDTPTETDESRLRRFLTWTLLVGIVFNIISWGGAAGILILRQSGVSIDWGDGGLLPIIQLDGPDTQQTIPPDATLPPTPLDITSVGHPPEPENTPVFTATRPAEDTPTEQPATSPATPIP